MRVWRRWCERPEYCLQYESRPQGTHCHIMHAWLYHWRLRKWSV